MTTYDAANFGTEVGNATGRDMILVTPGEAPIYTDLAGRVHVTYYLLIAEAGTVTMTTLAGQSRTFTATSNMSFPVRLDIFVTHVTAATADVYAVI